MATATKSSALLSPYTMGDFSLKNRVIMAPLTRGRAGKSRIPNELMAEYYSQRASAGLIITEATAISTQGYGWNNAPAIYTDEQVAGWKNIVDIVHEQETPIVLQLWHTGRASHSSYQIEGKLPVAPSAIKIEGSEAHTPNGKQPYETPRALETAEIPNIVEDYRKAAKRAKNAGFDGVEIHAANGYLIDQFLQSKTNHRNDRYGVSLENLYRFLQEVVEAVLTVFASGRVGIRLSPNGVFNDMGSPDYRETFLYVAQQLNDYNLAYLHLLDGLAFGFHELGEPMTLEEFRQVFNNSLVGNCGYTQQTAETAIVKNKADAIAFGRDFISNPDLVARFAHGWELKPPADMSVWYSSGEEGYTDFPSYLAKDK